MVAFSTAFFVSLAISVALSVGMSLLKSMLKQGGSQQQEYGGQLEPAKDPGTSLTLREAAAPQKVVFGTRRVAGTIVFAHCTDNNSVLHLVIVWAGHKVSSYGALFFGDEQIPLAFSAAQGRYAGYAYCVDYFGTDNQAADPNLINYTGGLWTAAHRGRGIAYSIVQLHWNRDLYAQFDIGKIWRVVNGMEVYDHRDGSTIFSANAALCTAAWMNSEKFGRGIPYSEMDLEELDASANICDENIDLEAGGTERRYRCDALLTADTPFVDNLGKLLSSMHGECGQTAGLWSIRAAAWEEPELIFDEGDFRETFTLTNGIGREGFNAIKGKFANPNKLFQPDDFPAITSDAYEEEDGGDRVFQDVNLECTTSASMAQRIARIDLRSARQPLAFTARLKLKAMRAVVGKNVAIDFEMLGWNEKPFRVKRIRYVPGFGPGGESGGGQPGIIGADLDLIETAEFIYDWTASDEIIIDPAPNTDLPNPFNVNPPSNLNTMEELYATRTGGGVKAKVTLTWDESPDAFVQSGGWYIAEFKLSTDSVWTKLPRVDDGATSIAILDVDPGTYDFRVWAFQWTGAKSAQAATIIARQIAGLSAPPGAPENMTISAIGGLAVIRWDFPTELDVQQGGVIVIRHSSLITGATWDAAISIGEALPANNMDGVLPLKSGTYLAKFRDASGVYSVVAAAFAQGQESIHQFTPLGSLVEDPDFVGVKTNVIALDGTLQLDGVGDFDSVPNVDAMATVDWLGGVVSTGSYAFSEPLDLLTSRRCRITGTVASQIFNIFDQIDLRTGDVDDWPSWDGDMSGDEADARLMVRATQDDPGGTPTWTTWQRLDSAEFEARGFEFRLDIASTDDSFSIFISTLSVVAEEVV